VARLLGKKGITFEPRYPDLSKRAKATGIIDAFGNDKIEDPKLLP